VPVLPVSKLCISCNQTKDISEFSVRNYKTETGNKSRKVASRCKPCDRTWQKKYYQPTPHEPHGLERPKTCRKCKTLKSATEFAIVTYASGRRGLTSPCKECQSQARTTEEARAANRAYTKKLKKEGRYTPRSKEYRAAYYQKNKDKIRLRNKAFRDANPEIMRKRYIAAIYKKISMGCDKRLKHVRESIEEVLESYRVGDMYWDVYSSELIEKPTIDHIVPLSSGGTNESANFCVTSLENNSSKNKMPLLVWLAKRAAKLAA